MINIRTNADEATRYSGSHKLLMNSTPELEGLGLGLLLGIVRVCVRTVFQWMQRI